MTDTELKVFKWALANHYMMHERKGCKRLVPKGYMNRPTYAGSTWEEVLAQLPAGAAAGG